MPSHGFETVAEDLIDCATSVAEYLRGHGYSIRIEPEQLGYPSVPTLVAKRAPVTIFVQVGRDIRSALIDSWVKYGKSCTKDTRIIFASDKRPTEMTIQFLRINGVGFFWFSAGGIVELLPYQDLAIQIGLPDLSRLNRKIRKWLAPCYERVERGDWRGGFDDACKVLEENARTYFVEFSSSGRILVMVKNVPTTLSKPVIDKLTLGQLKDRFAAIVNPSADDHQIGVALARINKDRVELTHRKSKATTERRLRKNVGQHMWVIIGALQILSKHI